MKELTGNEDQRYVTRDDHDAAKRWFKRTFKEKRKQIHIASVDERRENIIRLRIAIEEKLNGTTGE